MGSFLECMQVSINYNVDEKVLQILVGIYGMWVGYHLVTPHFVSKCNKVLGALFLFHQIEKKQKSMDVVQI